VAPVGAVLLAVAAVMIVPAAAAWTDRAAYAHAPACPATERCRTETTGVVTGRARAPGHRRGFSGTVSVWRGTRERSVTLDVRGVREAARPGTAVTVTEWRGRTTRISVGGRAAETEASPVTRSVELTTFAVAVGGFGVILVAVALKRRRLGRAAIVVFLGSVVALVAVDGFDVVAVLPWLLWFAAGLAAAAALLRLDARRPRRSYSRP
jgi:hypothetical protein